MNLRNFYTEDQSGAVVTEYVVFVAVIGVILAVGVTVLFNAMATLFGAWAQYFGAGS
jgi:Flp pilus assembly pilin Flp